MPRKNQAALSYSLFEEFSPVSNTPLDVDQLTARLQGLIAADPLMKSLVVVGEMHELKPHSSGHYYFTLLGKNSRVACALFKSFTSSVPQWPREGDRVLAEGWVDIYPLRGTYQFYARKLVPMGEGAIERARAETKMKLEAEGLFDLGVKRPLPRFPEKVALVTSRTGAAVKDVIEIASKRWKLCEIVVVPTQVQGLNVGADIVAALKRAAFIGGVECVMLVRGGGAREDLVPFDDPDVVRAVRACPLPLITGLGHQQDTTLADLAADVSAPTPSGAAERLFPDAAGVDNYLRMTLRRLSSDITERIDAERQRVMMTARRSGSVMTEKLIKQGALLDKSAVRLRSAASAAVSEAEHAIARRAASLDALSPLSVLARGFITCEKENVRVSSVRGLSQNDRVSLCFADGGAEAEIKTVRSVDK